MPVGSSTQARFQYFCVARSRDANVVKDSQEPHRHEMNATVFIKRREVSDESHVKKFVYLDLAKNKWLFAACISVSRVMVCHILLLT